MEEGGDKKGRKGKKIVKERRAKCEREKKRRKRRRVSIFTRMNMFDRAGQLVLCKQTPRRY